VFRMWDADNPDATVVKSAARTIEVAVQKWLDHEEQSNVWEDLMANGGFCVTIDDGTGPALYRITTEVIYHVRKA
jgi:hypothetical protein